MKRLLSIVVLGIFLYNIAGIFVIFKIQQQVIRKEIKKQIKRGVPQDELHTLVINAENYQELIWHNDHEFMYRGNMYDIVYKKITGETCVTYQCVNDTQESMLFKDLETRVDDTTDHRHHGKNQLKLIMLSYYINDTQETDPEVKVFKRDNKFIIPEYRLSEKHHQTAAQPPEQS